MTTLTDLTSGVEVHDQIETVSVLEGIVKRGEPGASGPCHDVPLLREESSL